MLARERRLLASAKQGGTFVWLLAVQKKAAIATRTTPPSKAHNQRELGSPSGGSEPSPA